MPRLIRRYIFSTDHKVIGLQYGFTSMFFLLVGFALVMLIRWQQAFPAQPIPLVGGWLGQANVRVVAEQFAWHVHYPERTACSVARAFACSARTILSDSTATTPSARTIWSSTGVSICRSTGLQAREESLLE